MVAIASLDRGVVETTLAGRVKVTYRVYAHDLTVRTCHLDGTHGFANGAAGGGELPNGGGGGGRSVMFDHVLS